MMQLFTYKDAGRIVVATATGKSIGSIVVAGEAYHAIHNTGDSCVCSSLGDFKSEAAAVRAIASAEACYDRE